MVRLLFAAAAGVAMLSGMAQAQPIASSIVDAKVQAIQPKVVAWRRDIHQNPELGEQEVRTAKLVADHLRALGLEVRTGVAKTGVIGILKGGKPGKVVALRADMDALPVEEKTGLPFASKKTAEYGGKTVPVMHACGHDGHTAMLMGAAEVLASMKADVPGTVVFIFQPAEEGAPPGKTEAGAPTMVKEGAFKDPKPDAIFGMHVFPGPVGRIEVRPGPYMAGSDTFDIVYKGKGTHGAMPWAGIDVVSLAAATVGALNTIAARQVDVTDTPTIITIGMLQAGTRFNIIPDEANLAGTMRTYGAERRKDVMARIERTVKGLAETYGAQGQVVWKGTNPAVINDADLTGQDVAGAGAGGGRCRRAAEPQAAHRVGGLLLLQRGGPDRLLRHRLDAELHHHRGRAPQPCAPVQHRRGRDAHRREGPRADGARIPRRQGALSVD